MNIDDRIKALTIRIGAMWHAHLEFQKDHDERMAICDEMLGRLSKLSLNLDDLNKGA